MTVSKLVRSVPRSIQPISTVSFILCISALSHLHMLYKDFGHLIAIKMQWE